MNYTTLSTLVQNYCENYEATFVANIPTFVKQAEQRIFNVVQFPSLRKSVTGTTTSNVAYLSCPTDFLSPYSMAVINAGVYSYLLNKDVSFVREAYPDTSVTGVPEYYALFGPQTGAATELSFILAPTPDTAYSVELHYFFYPESISVAASGTSWLGDNFDTVLLYGTLIEAYGYMKGEGDMVAYYDAKYKEALMLAKQLGDGLEKRDSYRSGDIRQII